MQDNPACRGTKNVPTLCEAGQFRAAEAAYCEALRLRPDAAVDHYCLGLALSALWQFTEADACYRKARSLDPSDVEIVKGLGDALAAQGRYDQAEAQYRTALNVDPDDNEALSRLGYVLGGLGRFPEAVAVLQDAVRLDTGREYAYTGLGIALARVARSDEAEAALRDALRADPDYADAHYGLGYLYLTLPGRADEAATELREALRLEPDDAGTHANLGSYYVITGELDAARSSFRTATQSRPVKHAFAEVMLSALERDTDPAATAEHAATVLALLDHPMDLIVLTPFRRAELRALALAALGRDQKGRAELQRAVPHRCAADVFHRQHYDLFAARSITGLLEIWRTIVAADPAAAPHGPP
jgi:Flp pilus assembly protein TadD